MAGKGVRAAGLAETVRSTVRAFANVDPSPAFILGKTNELFLRYDLAEPHVTAFLAVLDPRSARAVCASAGHPAPVLIEPLSCRLLEVDPGPPLNSVPWRFGSEEVALFRGGYLLLYTDGLTEARRGSEEFGEERLLAVAGSLRGRSAQDFAEGVRDAALQFAGSLRDDLNVVCVRLV